MDKDLEKYVRMMPALDSPEQEKFGV